MKKFVLCFLIATSAFISCSDDDSAEENGNGFSNSPVSGTLYGEEFTIGGGRAGLVTMFNVESVEIQISAEDLGCNATSGSTNFPIRITAPRAIGTYTTDVYVTFNDPDSESYISVSNGSTIEITSLTESMVKGKIMSSSTSTDNSINGTFEAPICQ